MEVRRGFEKVIDDIKFDFQFLLELGFYMSGETDLSHRASVGYKGEKYDFFLGYEFIEENFDFLLVDNKRPSVYIPLWKLIRRFDPSFDYKLAKPQKDEYRLAMKYISEKTEKIMPQILNPNFTISTEALG